MVIASSATSLHRKFCKPGVRMRGAVTVLSISLSYQCYQLSVLSWYQYKLCCLEGKTSWAIFSPAGRTTNAIRYNLKHPHPLQQTSDCAKVPSWINTSSRCSKSWNTKHFQLPSVAQRYPKIKHDKTRYIIPDKNVVATDGKKQCHPVLPKWEWVPASRLLDAAGKGMPRQHKLRQMINMVLWMILWR